MNNDNQTTALESAPEVNPFAERAATAAIEEQNANRSKIKALFQITNRKRRRPLFTLLFGPPGAGKSTHAATWPKPAMIPVERGLDQITVDKFPTPTTFGELWAQVEYFDANPEDHETLVLDTVDATDVLIQEWVIREAKKAGHEIDSIEEYGGGYGKGYQRAREIWTGLLKRLSGMSERFNVLLIAHSQLKTINVPRLAPSFDQYRIKIQDKSADIIRQMVDMILFVDLDVTVQKDSPKARKGRGIITGDRLLWTQPTTGIEAKNRYNLESPMEFSWGALEAGINKFYER
jgi:AAA domain